MPWTLLLDLRVLLGIALAASVAYGAVQRLEKEQAKAELAQFRADVESEAAKSKVAAAQEAQRQAQAAQEVLSDLQIRYVALNARYDRLRRTPAGGGTVPALSSAAPSLGSCPDGGDAAARLLAEIESRVTAVTEAGDREIAKYRELWELQLKNSALRNGI